MRSGIMLCYPFEIARFNKWKSKALIQPKLDGDRCRAIIDEAGKCTLYTSECNEIRSVPHINNKLESLNMHDAEFDGELYVHGAPHSDIHGIVSRTVDMHPNSDLMEFHIFDMVTTKPQYERIADVKNIFSVPAVPRHRSPINIVDTRLVETEEDIMEWMDIYNSMGYEGFVLRQIDAMYVRKRSTSLMKFKPRKDDWYTIVGYKEEIDKCGNPKNALGALTCVSNISHTTFDVGSGSLLTRDARQELWKNKETLPGKIAHVMYQHITSANQVPRFPVIVDIKDASDFGM